MNGIIFHEQPELYRKIGDGLALRVLPTLVN